MVLRTSVLCCLLSSVACGAIDEKISGYDVGLVRLVCQEPGPWTFRTTRTAEKDGTETLAVMLEASVDAAPPKFSVMFGMPQKDMCFFWSPSSPYCHVAPEWGAVKSSNIASWAPVYSIFNANDRNRFAFACSESQRVLNVKCGIRESDCTLVWRVDFFTAPEAPLRRYTTKLRFDARDVFWGDAISAASDWILSARGEKPCFTPETAFDPLYSTWYAFHHDVTDANVGAELELAAKLGMKTVILDDGWQSDDDKRGYSWCGDWQVSKQHFPDMAAHVAKAQKLGMKYMVWYSMPFMGRHSMNNARFKGKFLNREPVHGADILDPRFPEVRAFLADIYEKALDDWKLDGFKLDFIDQFNFHGTDPAIAENYAGRDVKCLSEAVDLLLKDGMARLKAKRPDLLVEFRQSYMGPAIRKYGNMIRVGDCPGSILANRVGIASLRLTSNGSAVHSDMLEWHPGETAESAARAILNCLYGVIQYSVRLGTLPESHRRMVAYWLRFSQEHRGALLKGAFRPHHPEAMYPILEGEDARERVFAAYTGDSVVVCGRPDRDVYVVNASGRKGLTLRIEAIPSEIEAFDTYGSPVTIARPTAVGVQDVAVPESGYVHLKW